MPTAQTVKARAAKIFTEYSSGPKKRQKKI